MAECDCSINLDHDHWKEWNQYFKDFNNVRIVPNAKQYKGPERMNVHYPLVRFIGKGELAEKKFKELENFKRDSTLILCNLKIPLSDAHSNVLNWVDKRPDITCLTHHGDVLVVQCKPKKDLNKKKEIENDIKGFMTVKCLAENYPIKSRKKLLSNDLEKWENLYNDRYPRHLKFPNFRETLFKMFFIKKEKELSLWTKRIMNCIRTYKLVFGFAFDGSMDKDTIQSLKYFDTRFLAEIGRNNNLFYFTVNRDKSFNVFKRSQLFNNI